jgi:putative hydrolase of the HAD superfamily
MPFPASRRDAWVFDLDNTLYDPCTDLFAQIDVRMTGYVSGLLGLEAGEARLLQKRYYAEHGTTLAGLMAVHGADPRPFLDHVHDIDLSVLDPDPALAALIKALPGRKFVFTNGSRGHAERVTARLGLAGLFDDLFDIEAAQYEPKPRPSAFGHLVERTGIDPSRSVMFEDMARNLAPAHALGFTTVLVASDKDWRHEPEGARPAGLDDPRPDHVHHVADCLKGFLTRVLETPHD